MKEARIRTAFGQISITYETTDQLAEALKDLEEQITVIQDVAGKIVPPPLRPPKPGYERVYRFLPNGDLELLQRPKNNNVLVALVLFAYAPEPLTVTEIETVSAIPDVNKLVLSQKQFSNYFHKTDDKWALLRDGFDLVEKKVKTVIPPSVQLEEEDSIQEEE